MTERTTAIYDSYQLEVRFGDKMMEAGFTAAPNLLLLHYHHLGISDAQAMWIVHLLRFKWTAAAPWPKASRLPMSASDETRRRYASRLRKQGLLFTRRLYHIAETAPSEELIGKMRALEYHFDSLFHNIVRIHLHLQAEKPLSDFVVEVSFETVKRVVTGYFQDVPKPIAAACEHHITESELGAPLLLQNGVVVKNSRSTTPTKASTRKTSARKASARKSRGHKEDSYSNEEPPDQEEEAAATKKQADAAVAPDLYKLLSDFGINEPALTELASDSLDLQTVKAWIIYVQTQTDLNRPEGYLVKRLRESASPPQQFLQVAQLSEEQLAVLKQLRDDRKWLGSWHHGRLQEAGIDEQAAETWYQSQREN